MLLCDALILWKSLQNHRWLILALHFVQPVKQNFSLGCCLCNWQCRALGLYPKVWHKQRALGFSASPVSTASCCVCCPCAMHLGCFPCPQHSDSALERGATKSHFPAVLWQKGGLRYTMAQANSKTKWKSSNCMNVTFAKGQYEVYVSLKSHISLSWST